MTLSDRGVNVQHCQMPNERSYCLLHEPRLLLDLILPALSRWLVVLQLLKVASRTQKKTFPAIVMLQHSAIFLTVFILSVHHGYYGVGLPLFFFFNQFPEPTLTDSTNTCVASGQL